MKAILGKCSLCGGLVEVESVSWCVNPPQPRCNNCGATPIKSELPTIPTMKRDDNYVKYFGLSQASAKQKFLNDNKDLYRPLYEAKVRDFFGFVNSNPSFFTPYDVN